MGTNPHLEHGSIDPITLRAPLCGEERAALTHRRPTHAARDERASFDEMRSRSKEPPDAGHSSGIRPVLPTTAPGATPSVASRLIELHAKLNHLNHFEVLDVPETADRQTIRKAFEQSARRFHPDRLRGDDARLRPLAAKIFLRMAEAYRALVDESTRKRYISSLGQHRPIAATTRRPGT